MLAGDPVPPPVIEVNVFADLNGNGVNDEGMAHTGDVTVYADVNVNGIYDEGFEPSAFMIAGGLYEFTANQLPPGLHYVRLDLFPSHQQTFPVSLGAYPVEVTATQTAPKTIEFGVRQVTGQGSVSGVVYEDVNGNGVRDAGESGNSGRTVFADYNRNLTLDGNEPSAVTDSNGNYTLTNLFAGPVSIKTILTGINVFTAAANGSTRVNVVPNQTVTAPTLGTRKFDTSVYLTQNFGTKGEAFISATTISAAATRQLADGKLLIAGQRNGVATIFRTTTTGALDTTFGGGLGYVQPNLPSGFVIKNMVLLSDERIVIGGQTPTSGNLEVAVLTSTGAFDNSFAGNGYQSVDFDNAVDNFVDVAVMPGNKIALLGWRTNVAGTDRETEIAVLQPNGALDVNFSGSGKGIYNFNASIDTPVALAVESDSQLVFIADRPLPAKNVTVVGRVNPTGLIDNGFGSAGSRVLEVIDESLFAGKLLIQSDNKILVSHHGSSGRLYANRLATNGTSDNTFGTAGRVSQLYRNGRSTFFATSTSVAVNASGNVALSGLLNAPGEATFIAAALVTPAGMRNAMFLRNGQLAHSITGSGSNDTAANVVLQGDNKLILTSTLTTAGRIGILQTGEPPARASVSGNVFDDLNGNGIRDAGESGAANRTVFLDFNFDGVRQSSESFATTDALGNYTISNFFTDDYLVTLTRPQGFEQTYNAGGFSSFAAFLPSQALTNQNFGLRQIQPVIVSSPGGPYAVAEGGFVQLLGSATGGAITGWEWDLNYDGTTFTVDSTQQNPAFAAGDLDGPGSQLIALRAKSGPLATSLISTAIVNVTNSNPTAVFTNNGPVGIGQSATVAFSQMNDPSAADRIAGFKYSYDFNNDGTFEIIDSNNATATVPSTITAAVGTYMIRGRIKDKDGGFNDYISTLTVNTTPPPPPPPTGGATLRGTVFLDTDRDGVFDTGEAGVAGRTIYLDLNNNVQRESNEPLTTTNANGLYEFTGLAAGTYKIRQVLPSGFTQTTPSNNFGNNATVSGNQVREGLNFGTIGTVTPPPPTGGATLSGTVFLDADRDGVFDTGESGVAGRTIYLDLNNNVQRDGNEPQTTTNSAGQYTFTGLSAGTYKIRQILPSGFIQTTPSNNFGNNATVTATQTRTGLNFGTNTSTVTPPPPPSGGSISGTVFFDTDRDAKFDTGEQGVSGRTVYLDLNNNNQRDSNEPQTTTNSSGQYSFSGLAANTYKVRQILPSGFIQTSPGNNFGNNVTLATNQSRTGVNFGTFSFSARPILAAGADVGLTSTRIHTDLFGAENVD